MRLISGKSPDPTLRKDFKDDAYWLDLIKNSRTQCKQLPAYGWPPTLTNMRLWLRRLDISKKEYLDATGYTSLDDFIRLNPDWPLRAFVGLLLEYHAEREGAKRVLCAYQRD